MLKDIKTKRMIVHIDVSEITTNFEKIHGDAVKAFLFKQKEFLREELNLPEEYKFALLPMIAIKNRSERAYSIETFDF